MNQADLKKDWLAGNSVVALGGALLLAQSWRLSGGVVELPFGRTIPDVLEVVYVAIVSFLLSANAALPDGLGAFPGPKLGAAQGGAVRADAGLLRLGLVRAEPAVGQRGAPGRPGLGEGALGGRRGIAFAMVVNPLLRMILGRR